VPTASHTPPTRETCLELKHARRSALNIPNPRERERERERERGRFLVTEGSVRRIEVFEDKLSGMWISCKVKAMESKTARVFRRGMGSGW
jgi:hypothetical protein